MDGVLAREGEMVPGADRFLAALRAAGRPFLVLTNNSIWTARDLANRLQHTGIDVREEEIWTSALATATFLKDQADGASVYVVGEAGLTSALHDSGFVITDTKPDYVVLGETRTYSFEAITRAIRHIGQGARFIATNPDPTGPSPEGPLPACGAVMELIAAATERRPYVIGKPNPVMFRYAMNLIGAHSESTTMVGDRMDTDVVAGMEAGLRTVLVLSGSTQERDIDRYPYRPTLVRESVADLVDLV
ncbi:HAD-IIA family hydrolase [Aquipuribacter sp. SD81]|uniref:HAD-IIA family hydrolase n=1 Tax=Aquipuribacter sp. SD81 TaxID=3127703 RepID=UPI00301999F0